MITSTGIHITPENSNSPSPRDIAVAMGRVCRFGGSVWSPLLAHSVMVGELVRRQLESENALGAELDTWAWSLLHDAHEVVMGEIPRPWKTPERKLAEQAFDRRIAEDFGINLDGLEHAVIHHADEQALLSEATVIGLPDFERIYAAHHGLDRFPTPPEDEINLMRCIVRSGLYRATMCTIENSACVIDFSNVLELIHARELNAALAAFNDLLRWSFAKE